MKKPAIIGCVGAGNGVYIYICTTERKRFEAGAYRRKLELQKRMNVK